MKDKEVFIESSNDLDDFEYLIQKLEWKDEFWIKCREFYDSFEMDVADAFPTTNLKTQIKSKVFDFINDPDLILKLDPCFRWNKLTK